MTTSAETELLSHETTAENSKDRRTSRDTPVVANLFSYMEGDYIEKHRARISMEDNPLISGDMRRIRERQSTLNILNKSVRTFNRKFREFSRMAGIYHNLHLWIFSVPLVVLQTLATILTAYNIKKDSKSTEHVPGGKMQMSLTVVTIINAFTTVWVALQLKLNWSEKCAKLEKCATSYHTLAVEGRTLRDLLTADEDKGEDEVTRMLTDFMGRVKNKEESIAEQVPQFVISNCCDGAVEDEDATAV